MLTEHQKKLMDWIAYNEYSPVMGEYPEDEFDADCFLFLDEMAAYLELTINQTKGVLGSLVAQKYVEVMEDNPDDGVHFTKQGYGIWHKMNEENNDT